jgi:hypothetical protein
VFFYIGITFDTNKKLVNLGGGKAEKFDMAGVEEIKATGDQSDGGFKTH